MATFISSEQRARSAVFDQLIDNTDKALRSSEVITALGALASDLLTVNNQAFLPNMRDGKFYVPKQHQDTLHVAITPVTDAEAPTAFDLLDPLLERYDIGTFPDVLTSEAYGIHKTVEEFRQYFTPRPKIETAPATPPRRGLKSPTNMAHTTMSWELTKNDMIRASRPVEIVRMSLVNEDAPGQAGVMGHEHVHALDIVNDNILYMFDEYSVASEVRAYEVLYEVSKGSSLECYNAIVLHALRKKYPNPDPRYPHTPTPEMLRAMESEDINF